MRKSTICKMYYYTMISCVFTLICGVACGVVTAVYFNEFYNDYKVFGTIFVIFIISLSLFLILSSLKGLICLLKDFRDLKNNKFITVIGKVIKFERNREPESGAQINDKPVVMILDTNEQIVLSINDETKIGETYKFNYLKNCKIAEIVEKLISH